MVTAHAFILLSVKQLSVVLFAVSALPQPPDNLFLLETTCSSVRLAWNSTSSRMTAPVKSYVVQYQPNGSFNNYMEMSVSKPEVFVEGLSARTSYEFNIFAVGNVGRSPSAASIVVTTSHAVHTGLLLFTASTCKKCCYCLKTVKYRCRRNRAVLGWRMA